MSGPGTKQEAGTRRPRIGFLGAGWIGQNRMKALVESALVDVTAIMEPNPDMQQKALEIVPDAMPTVSVDELLNLGLDGIVISTPSALHAEQSIAALESGISVFCQKPLGRNAGETAEIVDVARRADRLLSVDLSYRFVDGVSLIPQMIASGELGQVFAVDLVFHNAYGPDKDWFFDRSLSGGGCLIDLGVHLVDLALWSIGFPEAVDASAAMFAKGERLRRLDGRVEDYVTARVDLDNGAVLNVACSWNLQAGVDAEISAGFFGEKGGVRLSNVGGSFFDLRCERLAGTARETVGSTGDSCWEWGGGAIKAWAKRLLHNDSFDPECERNIDVARTIDLIYSSAIN